MKGRFNVIQCLFAVTVIIYIHICSNQTDPAFAIIDLSLPRAFWHRFLFRLDMQRLLLKGVDIYKVSRTGLNCGVKASNFFSFEKTKNSHMWVGLKCLQRSKVNGILQA